MFVTLYDRVILSWNLSSQPQALSDISKFCPRRSKNKRRGDFKIATSAVLGALGKKINILACSWLDGSNFNMLSNADGVGPAFVRLVKRTVGGNQMNVPAPMCIPEYNKNRGGVDKFDQYLKNFALGGGISWKKWH